MLLGDAISSGATPIARALQLGCIDPATQQLKPESRCNQWRLALNDWFKRKEKGEKVKFRIQLDIEANKASDIDTKQIEQSCNCEIISINPAPQLPPARPTQSPALAARTTPPTQQ